jgi:hypothetical protein
VRIVLRGPAEPKVVRYGGAEFKVRQLTRALNYEIDAALRKRFPDGPTPYAFREAETLRSILVGFAGVTLSDGRVVEWEKGCPGCGGTGTDANRITCTWCPKGQDAVGHLLPGTGDIKDFAVNVFPDELWDLLLQEARRAQVEEEAQGKA